MQLDPPQQRRTRKRLHRQHAIFDDEDCIVVRVSGWQETGMAEAATNGDKVVAGKVAFAELCGLLEKLSKTQGNEKKKRVLREFVDRWRRLHSEVHSDDADTTVRVTTSHQCCTSLCCVSYCQGAAPLCVVCHIVNVRCWTSLCFVSYCQPVIPVCAACDISICS